MSDLEYSDEEFDYEDDEEMLDADADGALWALTTHLCTLTHASSADSASEMDIEAFDSFQPAAKGKEKSYDVPHRSLSQMEVEKTMAEDVEHISGIFGVDVRACAQLSHLPFLISRPSDGYCGYPSTTYGLE
jgi:ariadne-1